MQTSRPATEGMNKQQESQAVVLGGHEAQGGRAVSEQRKRKRGGPRHCKFCRVHIHPGQPSVRVADIQDTSNPIGRLRYWLCWFCADKVGDAIEKAST